jgi:undecaprenyl-diphosphatase
MAVAGLAALLLAVKICGELLEGESFRFDPAILEALRQPGHPATPIGPTWLLQSAIDLSALGGFTLLCLFSLAGLGYLVWIGRRAEAAWIAASLIGASLLNLGLKSWMHRPRPLVVPHLAQVTTASFPSGHAMVSAAVYLTLGLMLAEAESRAGRRLFIAGFAALLVVLIGCSRVYLGVHWPSDVLAGWCFGGVWALVVFAAERWLKAKARAAASPPP